MKHSAIFLFVLVSFTAFSADPARPQKKVISHVQFYFGEYVSTTFLPHWQQQVIVPWAGIPSPRPSFGHMFSMAGGFEYKAEFSKHFGLRTGINYFCDGSHKSGLWHLGDTWYTDTYTQNYYVAYFNIPLHADAYVPLKHGRLVISAGPDLNLAINTFGNEQVYSDLGNSYNTISMRGRADKEFFMSNSALGFTAGLGYEKKLRDKLAVEVMPDARLLNALPFDYTSPAKTAYRNYPFSLAFGLSTYITFY